MESFYSNWIFWVYVIALMPFLLTSMFYGFGSPWWTSHIGRSLLMTEVAILAVLSNVLFTLTFGDNYELRDFTRTVLLGGVTVGGWYQFGSILREQRLGRALDRLKEEQPPQVHITVTQQDTKLIVDTRDPEEQQL